MPEAFHARFPVSVKSYKVTMPKCLRPVADETKLPVAPTKKPLVPRVRLSGHFSIFGLVFFVLKSLKRWELRAKGVLKKLQF